METITEKPVDMALSKAELKEKNTGMMPTIAGGASKGPKYPWGLELRLEESSLKKLGMDGELPEVGELCQIVGVGRVISVSQRESADNSSKTVEIQIEKLNLAVQENPDEADDAAFEAGAKKGRSRGSY